MDKKHLSIVVVASMLSFIFGGVVFSLLKNPFNKQKEYVCEGGVRFKLVNDVMLLKNLSVFCERTQGYILCNVPLSSKQLEHEYYKHFSGVMKNYIGFREIDSRLFILTKIELSLIRDESFQKYIQDLIKQYGQEKAMEIICRSKFNKDLNMCIMNGEGFRCKRI